MTARDWRTLGCAALAGALVAFPAGLIVASRHATPERIPAAAAIDRAERAQPKSRNVYSPHIINDPYVMREQRRVADALEAECRHSGEHCTEAAQARRWLRQQDPSN